MLAWRWEWLCCSFQPVQWYRQPIPSLQQLLPGLRLQPLAAVQGPASSFYWARKGTYHRQQNLSEGRKYTPKVFSALKTQVLNRQKRCLVYAQKLVLNGKRGKIHIHQRAFKVFVRDPFAQYWCIDFGLLIRVVKQNALGIKFRIAVAKAGLPET